MDFEAEPCKVCSVFACAPAELEDSACGWKLAQKRCPNRAALRGNAGPGAEPHVEIRCDGIEREGGGAQWQHHLCKPIQMASPTAQFPYESEAFNDTEPQTAHKETHAHTIPGKPD